MMYHASLWSPIVWSYFPSHTTVISPWFYDPPENISIVSYLKLSVCQSSYSQRLTAFIKPVGNRNEKDLILFYSGHEKVVLKWIWVDTIFWCWPKWISPGANFLHSRGCWLNIKAKVKVYFSLISCCLAYANWHN